MSTSPIGATSGTSDPAAQIPATGNPTATKENFLQLLVAQIKNQNPLNPADGTQFLSQLSQFTEMEQMLGMREELKTIRETLTAATAPEPTN